MSNFTSSMRYVKRDVKTTIVDKWVPGKWQTVQMAELYAAFATRDQTKAIDLMANALKMNGKRRVWFTTVYLIFDPCAVEPSGDTRVLGIMSEVDFLVRFLASPLPPLQYRRYSLISRAFVENLCKKYIRSF